MFSPKKKKLYLCDVMLGLVNIIIAIILYYKSVSKSQVVHLKLSQHYILMISQ